MKKIICIKKQAGFNLIEVLLAFLILSIGLLGIAGLQTTAVKASHTAILKTIAITKVSEIIERMRANSASPVDNYALAKGLDVVGADNNCAFRGTTAVSECTPAELAANDLFDWHRSLTNGGLPTIGTTAEIVIDNALVPPMVTVTIFWKERGDDMSYSSSIQRI